jgi:hypothetical protein
VGNFQTLAVWDIEPTTSEVERVRASGVGSLLIPRVIRIAA